MSAHPNGSDSCVSLYSLRAKYRQGQKLSMLTCYDAAFGSLLNDCQLDFILVGDSLGNVLLGHKDTTQVTMAHMLHHTRALTEINPRAFVVMDLPFLSYQISNTQALENAAQAIALGRAKGVKLEGGFPVIERVRAIAAAGIPVMGHLGLTPQSVHALGGYRVQGRDAEAQDRLMAEALALEEAGAFALVLEMVPASLAAEITERLSIPTIGIGAGPGCSGQVLVLHDMLGLSDQFRPRFAKAYAGLAELVRGAVNQYIEEVQTGQFPDAHHSFI